MIFRTIAVALYICLFAIACPVFAQAINLNPMCGAIAVPESLTEVTKPTIDLYHDVLNGRKPAESLRPEEIFQIQMLVDNYSPCAKMNLSPECRDATEMAERTNWRAITATSDLSTCLKSGNFNDDCSNQFRNAQDGYESYERAAITFRSVCD